MLIHTIFCNRPRYYFIESMDKSLVSKRYGKALFQIYEEKKSCKAFDKSLKKINDFILANSDISVVLSSPAVPKNQRVLAAKNIAEKLSLEGEVSNFFVLLVANKKIELLDSILDTYTSLVDNSKNIIKVTISFADKVSKDLISEIIKIIEDATKMKVNCETCIDNDLVGGFTIQYKSLMLDNSVKNQLNILKKMTEERFHSYELNVNEKKYTN